MGLDFAVTDAKAVSDSLGGLWDAHLKDGEMTTRAYRGVTIKRAPIKKEKYLAIRQLLTLVAAEGGSSRTLIVADVLLAEEGQPWPVDEEDMMDPLQQ